MTSSVPFLLVSYGTVLDTRRFLGCRRLKHDEELED